MITKTAKERKSTLQLKSLQNRSTTPYHATFTTSYNTSFTHMTGKESKKRIIPPNSLFAFMKKTQIARERPHVGIQYRPYYLERSGCRQALILLNIPKK
jgi:hypothetical protein